MSLDASTRRHTVLNITSALDDLDLAADLLVDHRQRRARAVALRTAANSAETLVRDQTPQIIAALADGELEPDQAAAKLAKGSDSTQAAELRRVLEQAAKRADAAAENVVLARVGEVADQARAELAAIIERTDPDRVGPDAADRYRRLAAVLGTLAHYRVTAKYQPTGEPAEAALAGEARRRAQQRQERINEERRQAKYAEQQARAQRAAAERATPAWKRRQARLAQQDLDAAAHAADQAEARSPRSRLVGPR